MPNMTQADKRLLKMAYDVLESPGFAIQVMNQIGKPLELGMSKLPEGISKKIEKVSKYALTISSQMALFTLSKSKRVNPSNILHRATVLATGFGGGFFGLYGTLAEIPVSTTIMMRSILDIARSEGEDLSSPEARIAALQVFALGGNNPNDDLADTAYYTVRTGMSLEVKAALDFLSKSGGKLADKNAPVIVQLISKIAARFGVTVSEKAAAQAMPFVGGAIGALINNIFISHYQDMAHGHFTVRRLERKYGKELVQETYESFKK